jgi:DNA-binding NarL/FixJ family response regulator
MAAERDDVIRVLVVDDHAVVRRGLQAFLGGEPDIHVLGGAEGAEEALDMLAGLDEGGDLPHVVVMDLQMEPVDGIEATREIRTRYYGIEVVVLTSFGEPERVRAALEAGASGYILKDADADEVANAVRSAHRGELLLDAAVVRGLTGSLTPAVSREPELTTRELEVLRLLGEGEPNKSIAAALGISERTARTHVSNILAKLGLSSRTQAALWAAREGIAARLR